jgi:hypothetical protein
MDPTTNPSQGLLLPAGFYAPIVGGGSFDSCVAESGVPATCDKLVVDMDGAFNWWGTDAPVPDSIYCNQYGVCAVLGGRANARERLRGVQRHTDLLPAPTFPADTLIVRRSGGSVFSPMNRARVDNGCVLPPVAAQPFNVVFGVNDRAVPAPTKGGLMATVLLAQSADQSKLLFGSSALCQMAPSSGGTLGTTTGTLSR